MATPEKSQPPSKQSLMNASGFSTLKYTCLLVLGVGMIGLASSLALLAREKPHVLNPLPAITHTTEMPDTGELVHRVNEQRQKNNRTDLVIDDRLTKVADKRLKDMIASQQYSHKNLAGKYYYDLLPEAGYRSSYSCENLDIEPSVKPTDFVASWMSSGSGHRECMLNNKVARVGVASGKFTDSDTPAQDTFLVVAIFAATPQENSEDKQN
jgi:hypothetical protein